MLTFFINRAGRNLSASRRRELEKAKKLLSERVQKARRAKASWSSLPIPARRWVDFPRCATAELIRSTRPHTISCSRNTTASHMRAIH